MTMTGSPNQKACTSSPKRCPRCYHKYLKPGALAKLRDSKITARHNNRRTTQIFLSELLLSPTSASSPTQQDQSLNEDNGVPCFAPPICLSHRPRCLLRKKLFAFTPSFTHAETYQF
ncbi:hypothetical protein E2542_SST20634 [Spatholobus suberectus]|nr:hypothetical protein E2542_SST20634 [Spatholobus suberectus]